MLAQMRPYIPSLYQPDSFARYRKYPRTVVTPIPGAGYDVKNFVWAEQELNLDGGSLPQPYGDYEAVPLRGLGATAPGLFDGTTAVERLAFYESLPPHIKSQVSAADVTKLRNAAAAERTAAASARTEAERLRIEAELPPPSEGRRAADAAEAARQAEEYTPPELLTPEPSFFERKVGPVPMWAIVGGGALAVVGGGLWWMKRRKK
jgi:hypothetical protein